MGCTLAFLRFRRPKFDTRLIVLSDLVTLSLAQVAFLSTPFSPIRADAKLKKINLLGMAQSKNLKKHVTVPMFLLVCLFVFTLILDIAYGTIHLHVQVNRLYNISIIYVYTEKHYRSKNCRQ